MSEGASRTVKTGRVRFSYVNIWEARSSEEGEEPKFSSAIVIPKGDKATLALIEAAIEVAKQEGKAKKWGGKIPGNLKLPLRDGDAEKPDDEVYAGNFWVNASNKKRPIVLGMDNEVMYEKEEFYSGVYGRAVLTFYPFTGKSNGIAVALEAVRKLDDGEALSGGISLDAAKNAFGDDDGDDLM